MGTYGTIPKSDFHWTKGVELLTSYNQNKSLKRIFCSACGSFIAGTHDLDSENIFLSLGCLESEIDLKIKYQQFVDSKASWISLDENIRQHSEWPEWVYEKVRKKDT